MVYHQLLAKHCPKFSDVYYLDNNNKMKQIYSIEKKQNYLKNSSKKRTLTDEQLYEEISQLFPNAKCISMVHL